MAAAEGAPIGVLALPVGTNRYAYAANDPINKADPNGHVLEGGTGDEPEPFAPKPVPPPGSGSIKLPPKVTAPVAATPDTSWAKAASGTAHVVEDFTESVEDKFETAPVVVGYTPTDIGGEFLDNLTQLGTIKVHCACGPGYTNIPASMPVGSRRSQLVVVGGGTQNPPGAVNNRDFSGHAFDSMRNRGIPPTVVENTINVGVRFPSRGAAGYYDPVNNIRVYTDRSSGRVITVVYGPPPELLRQVPDWYSYWLVDQREI